MKNPIFSYAINSQSQDRNYFIRDKNTNYPNKFENNFRNNYGYNYKQNINTLPNESNNQRLSTDGNIKIEDNSASQIFNSSKDTKNTENYYSTFDDNKKINNLRNNYFDDRNYHRIKYNNHLKVFNSISNFSDSYSTEKSYFNNFTNESFLTNNSKERNYIQNNNDNYRIKLNRNQNNIVNKYKRKSKEFTTNLNPNLENNPENFNKEFTLRKNNNNDYIKINETETDSLGCIKIKNNQKILNEIDANKSQNQKIENEIENYNSIDKEIKSQINNYSTTLMEIKHKFYDKEIICEKNLIKNAKGNLQNIPGAYENKNEIGKENSENISANKNLQKNICYLKERIENNLKKRDEIVEKIRKEKFGENFLSEKNVKNVKDTTIELSSLSNTLNTNTNQIDVKNLNSSMEESYIKKSNILKEIFDKNAKEENKENSERKKINEMIKDSKQEIEFYRSKISDEESTIKSFNNNTLFNNNNKTDDFINNINQNESNIFKANIITDINKINERINKDDLSPIKDLNFEGRHKTNFTLGREQDFKKSNSINKIHISNEKEKLEILNNTDEQIKNYGFNCRLIDNTLISYDTTSKIYSEKKSEKNKNEEEIKKYKKQNNIKNNTIKNNRSKTPENKKIKEIENKQKNKNNKNNKITNKINSSKSPIRKNNNFKEDNSPLAKKVNQKNLSNKDNNKFTKNLNQENKKKVPEKIKKTSDKIKDFESTSIEENNEQKNEFLIKENRLIKEKIKEIENKFDNFIKDKNISNEKKEIFLEIQNMKNQTEKINEFYMKNLEEIKDQIKKDRGIYLEEIKNLRNDFQLEKENLNNNQKEKIAKNEKIVKKLKKENEEVKHKLTKVKEIFAIKETNGSVALKKIK